MNSPARSTTIQRRSWRRPKWSTSHSGGEKPPQDLTGYTWREARCSIERYPLSAIVVWLRGHAADHDRDVVAGAGRERIFQQRLAGLLRRARGEQPFANPGVGDVLGESVTTEQSDVVPDGVEPGDDRSSLGPADRAREYVRPARLIGVRAAHDPLIDQVLRHGLIARDLLELAPPEQVTAAVPHLKQVGPGPH